MQEPSALIATLLIVKVEVSLVTMTESLSVMIYM